MLVVTARRSFNVAALVLGLSGAAGAQARVFVHTVVPSPAGAPGASIFTDISYGHGSFTALGPESFEQRLGVQLDVSHRVTLLAQAGWAPSDPGTSSNAAVQGELLADVLRRSSPIILAVGAGAMLDYSNTPVALGRVVAGYRWAHTLAAANLRLERPLPHSDASPDARRDAVDVISVVGVSHEVSTSVRLGVESMAEDLEGFLEPDEAEGGAKLMLGPSVGIGSRDSRWAFSLAAGPVFRLTQSTVSSPAPGAPRELASTGFAVRTSLGWQW